MNYCLMHKNVIVALLELDEETGFIQKTKALYESKHLPCGIKVVNGLPDRAALNDWWLERSIPATRSGIARALEVLELKTTKMLLLRCFGLSLSDQYWMKPEGSALEWEQVNFFENAFSEDIGNVLLGKTDKAAGFDLSSPDNTSDGSLKKCWKIVDGKRVLLKSGSNPFQQQPFNEVIASAVARRLQIPHVEYKLLWDEDLPYSVCEDFINSHTELVSAWRIMQGKKRENSVSLYRHYINCCEELGVKNIVRAVDQMIVLDYIIANEDRHQNNFGLIRNADSLQWIGAAPIFDSGSSLGYDRLAGSILSGKDIVCKPFKKRHEDQIKLVTNFDWVDFDALSGLEDEIAEILSAAGERVDDMRKDAIIKSVSARIFALKKLASRPCAQRDDLSEDVTVNRIEDYRKTKK